MRPCSTRLFAGSIRNDMATGAALTLVEQFVVGENSSTTTGPTQPFVVENEVWIPNRGDDRLFAVTR